MVSIKFLNPKKSHVILFDQAGSDVLEKMVLKGIDHVLFYTRYEELYITPRILWGFLRNIKHVNRMRHGAWSRHLIKLIKQLFGSLFRVYLLACIEYIQPKVVVSFQDNSYPYQVISRVYKNARFIAFQNGIRNREGIRDSLPPIPQPGSIISIPMLICFGEYDVNLYRTYKHQIDAYYPLGALRGRYYKSVLSKPRLEREFDLCLISEWGDDIFSGQSMPFFRKGIMAIDSFLGRYIKEEKKSLCIALRSKNKKEEEYYLNQYGGNATLIRSNKELMASYDAIDRSSVTINLLSTLGYEAFGWGAKVLFCNFSGYDQYDFPSPGFWSIKEQDYEMFKERLNDMLAMDHEEYRRLTKDRAAYMMNNDSKPPHEFARELIFKQLGANGE